MQNWCQKHKLNYEINPLVEFSLIQMKNYPPHTSTDHKLLDRNSRYWDWPTTDIKNKDVLALLDFMERAHALPVNTRNTRIALWEYGKGDVLPVHVDLNISLSSTIVVPIVGEFETRFHSDHDDETIFDIVTYGPGDYLILNNTVYRHSGRPLGDYRLALVIFVDPHFDMKPFWSKHGNS